MAAAAQDAGVFLVDRVLRPWNNAPLLEAYSREDSDLIEEGIKYMLASGERQWLVLLTPLANGTMYYVAIFRNGGSLNLVQFRIQIMPTGMKTRFRAVQVPDRVRMLYGIGFTSDAISQDDDTAVFWDVHHDCWASVFRAIRDSRLVLAGLESLKLGYNLDRFSGWKHPRHFDLCTLYGMDITNQMKIALRGLCSPDAASTLMVCDPFYNRHFVAFLARRNSVRVVEEIKVVDIEVEFGELHGERNTMAWERKVAFPPDMGNLFPNIRFESERLTDAEKHVLFQEPVLRYYQGGYDRYYGPRLLALAMGMHERLSKPDDTPGVALPDVRLRNLDSELVAKIAALAL